MAHLSHDFEAHEAKQAFAEFERRLARLAPKAWASLAHVFDSDYYFGAYDWYCSDNFIEQTSPELALAVWGHLAQRERSRVEDQMGSAGGPFSKLAGLWAWKAAQGAAEASRAEIEGASAHAARPRPPSPRL